MGRNTRRRQLQKLAERRAAERRRRRRRKIVAGTVAGALVLGAGGATALTLLRGGGEARPQAGPETTPTPEPSPTPDPDEVACGGKVPKAARDPKPTFDQPPELRIDRQRRYLAAITTSCGEIELELFADETPVTVNNFVFLSRQGFYDGLIFHRVIEGFMNQGGDPEGTGSGGPGYQFTDEIVKNLRFDEPGLLAMANSGEDTNGSQFFITAGPAEHLNGLHTIFGRVVRGMDVVRRINGLPTDETDRPVRTVYIERVTIAER